jgi:hypothetical protein
MSNENKMSIIEQILRFSTQEWSANHSARVIRRLDGAQFE